MELTDDVRDTLRFVENDVDGIDHIARACRVGPDNITLRVGTAGTFWMAYTNARTLEAQGEKLESFSEGLTEMAMVCQDLKERIEKLETALKKKPGRPPSSASTKTTRAEKT